MSEERVSADGRFITGPNNLPVRVFGDTPPISLEQREALRQAEHDRVWQAINARQERERLHAEQVERERRERSAADLEAYRLSVRTQWLDNGGDESSFNRAWPDIRDRHLAEALTAQERAYQTMRTHPRYARW